jgi:hypothetical protein
MATTESFTKLLSSITKSSKWCGPNATLESKVVWITMMAHVDRNGNLIGWSVPGLAKEAGVSIEECEKALAIFMAPDPYSSSPEHEGRSIEKIDRGWHLLNFSKIRDAQSVEDKREYNKNRIADIRATGKHNDSSMLSDVVKSCQSNNMLSDVVNVVQAYEDEDEDEENVRTNLSIDSEVETTINSLWMDWPKNEKARESKQSAIMATKKCIKTHKEVLRFKILAWRYIETHQGDKPVKLETFAKQIAASDESVLRLYPDGFDWENPEKFKNPEPLNQSINQQIAQTPIYDQIPEL